MIFPWVDESLTTKYTKATTTLESQTPPLGSEESLDDLGNRLKEKVKREKIISQSALEIERIKAEEASRIKENQAELDRADRKIQQEKLDAERDLLVEEAKTKELRNQWERQELENKQIRLDQNSQEINNRERERQLLEQEQKAKAKASKEKINRILLD